MIINTSQHAYSLLKNKICLEVEEVWLIALNSELKIIKFVMVFRGTVDQCQFHPRDIIRFLCLQNASSFIIAHSHPSGNHLPSRQDLKVTRNLEKICSLLQIPLLDHLIISKNGYSSLKDRGFFHKKAAVNESLARLAQQL